MARIPISRVIEKLDNYLNLDNDYAAGERHLKYWLEEAKSCGDDSGAFTVLNEMIGLYRKGGKKEEALEACSGVLEMVERLGIADDAGGATAFLNTATARKAFGDPEGAAALYERARTIYERDLDKDDPRLAGLYNNYALALTDLGRFEEAETLFFSALAVLEQKAGSEPDRAVTYLNLAENMERKLGFAAAEEKILTWMDAAWELLNRDTVPRNGYYAFVAEKCAPLFRHYEYYLAANELEARAARIRRHT